jgi:3'-phosphoadenosine 5'-phosphosulfate (PAPS) 3'-phosphatase
MAEFMDLLDSPTFKSYGSSLKLLMVAEGEAHIYPRWAQQQQQLGGVLLAWMWFHVAGGGGTLLR